MPLHDVSAFGLGDPLRGLVDGGSAVPPVAARPIRRRSGRRSRPMPAPRSSRGGSASRRSTRPRSPRRHAPRPDLAGPDAGRRARRRLPAGVALRSGRGPGPRRAAATPSRRRLGRFFGKRGGAVVDANLAIIGDAYDSLIDVSARDLARRRLADRRPGKEPSDDDRRDASSTVGDAMDHRADRASRRERLARREAAHAAWTSTTSAASRSSTRQASLVGVLSQTRPRPRARDRVPLGQLAGPRACVT